MNKNKHISLLKQRIEMLEEQNEDLKLENQELKLTIEEYRKHDDDNCNLSAEALKSARIAEAVYKSLIKETRIKEKKLDEGLAEILKTHRLFKSIFSD